MACLPHVCGCFFFHSLCFPLTTNTYIAKNKSFSFQNFHFHFIFLYFLSTFSFFLFKLTPNVLVRGGFIVEGSNQLLNYFLTCNSHATHCVLWSQGIPPKKYKRDICIKNENIGVKLSSFNLALFRINHDNFWKNYYS